MAICVAEYFNSLDKQKYAEVFDKPNINHRFHFGTKGYDETLRKMQDDEIDSWERVFTEFEDLARGRIVCRLMCQVDFLKEKLVCEFLRDQKNFAVSNEEDYRIAPKSSGYRTIQFNLQVPLDSSPPVLSELQLRTELEDTWAELEHYLIYKNRTLKASKDARKPLVLEIMPCISNVLHTADEMLRYIRAAVKQITPRFQ